MTPAQHYLARQQLPVRVALLPQRVRDAICNSFAHQRGHFHNRDLHDKIFAEVMTAERKPRGVPMFVWVYLLRIAVEVIVRILERWWAGGTTERRWGG